MKLPVTCRKELEEAEGKVEILLKRNGKLQPEALKRYRNPTPKIAPAALHDLMFCTPGCDPIQLFSQVSNG